MKNFKRIINKLLFPHIVLVAVLAAISVIMLTYAFSYQKAKEAVKYVAYFISAYALVILCIRIPEFINRVKLLRQKNKYVNKYINDVYLRVKISLYLSLIMNAGYAVFQLGLGYFHRSVWFYSLAAYYLLLAIMRFFLLGRVRALNLGENRLSELKICRFCGMILLCMNLALAVIVFYITRQNKGFVHHSITTIAMATYTFTSFTLAIINAVKYRKYNSPVLSAAKAISLVAASVSMLTLQTAMLTVFGEENDPIFRLTMTSFTGSGVCFFVLATAIYIIVSSNAEIRQMKGNK